MVVTAPDKKQNKRVTQPVSQDDHVVIAGHDCGNNTLVMVYAFDKKTLKAPKTFKSQSWITEHIGSLHNLTPMSNSKGMTFTYRKGNPEFEGRTFLCGRSALAKKGASRATLIGDDKENKVSFGLPMLLFSLASQLDRRSINAIVVSNTHKGSLKRRLKDSLTGNHEIEILSRNTQGDLAFTPCTITVRSSVTQEGLGGLWHLSGAGDTEGNHVIDFTTMNLLIDGGGGTFDVLLIEDGQVLRSRSVSIGGNTIVNELLTLPTFQELFPESINIDREQVELAIKNGSWTYKKGDVNVNFSKVGKDKISEFIPIWKSVIDDVALDNVIDKTTLIGGLFETKYNGDPNGEPDVQSPWSLAEILQDQFINHDFVLPEDPQSTNAKGLFEMAIDLHEKLGK
jgi:hypothetical protein